MSVVARLSLCTSLALAACSVPATQYTGPGGDGSADTPMLEPSAASYEFGTVVIATRTAPATFVFTNRRALPTPPLTAAALGGPGAVLFALGVDGCAGKELAPGERCAVEALMAPSSEGTATAVLTVGTAQGGGGSVALSGRAVTPGALRIAPTTTTFAAVAPDAVSADTTFTATNTGGSATGTIAVTVSGTDASQFAIASDLCSGMTLAAGASCTIKARFAPRSAGGKAASLTAASPAGGTAVAALGGHALLPAALAITPPTVDFGKVVVNATSAPTTFTVTNTGELPSGAIATRLTGTPTEYQVIADGCAGKTLAAAATCTIAVVYAPTAAADAPTQLTVSAGPGGSAASALSATGIPPAALAFMPAAYSFNTVDVGATATTTFMLTNTGGQASSAIATSIAGTNASDVTITSDACNGLALGAGASCAIAIAFTPGAYGARAAQLVASASTGGLTTASLSGTGRDKVALTLSTAGGSGTGAVTCNGAACAAQYYRGTQLTLAETPDLNMIFGGWSGACAGTASTCTVTLAAPTTVTAAFLPATQDLRLAVAVTGTGAITTSPAGVACGTGCLRFPTGTIVALTAAPSAGNYLASWAGDCVGNGLTCQLTMAAGRSVSATFTPANRAFVTSGTYWPATPNPGAWADATCQAAAQAAGVTGTFVGWLNYDLDAAQTAWSTRLGNASGWVRMDGKPFAASKAELLAHHSLYPLSVDERGGAVAADAQVLSGGPGSDCSGWTVSNSSAIYSSGYAGGGWSQAAWFLWLGYGACGTKAHLYCFQTDYNVNLTYPRATGRVAFSATTAAMAGLASFDALCATRASAAGLPGTYKALAATPTASAASRFSTAGAPWVRTDGIPLVAAAGDLFLPTGPQLVAGLDLNELAAVAKNNSSTFMVAIGAPDLVSVGSDASTCAGWTDASSTSSSLYAGQPSYPTVAFAHSNNLPCNWPVGVYCLQQ